MMREETVQEKDYGKLLDEKGDKLSEAARGIYNGAHRAAYGINLVPSVIYYPCEYDEEKKRMLDATTRITRWDRKTLREIAHAGFFAAYSLRYGDQALVGRKMDVENLHQYYKTLSHMIEDTLEETSPKHLQQSWGEPVQESE